MRSRQDPESAQSRLHAGRLIVWFRRGGRRRLRAARDRQPDRRLGDPAGQLLRRRRLQAVVSAAADHRHEMRVLASRHRRPVRCRRWPTWPSRRPSSADAICGSTGGRRRRRASACCGSSRGPRPSTDMAAALDMRSPRRLVGHGPGQGRAAAARAVGGLSRRTPPSTATKPRGRWPSNTTRQRGSRPKLGKEHARVDRAGHEGHAPMHMTTPAAPRPRPAKAWPS